MTKATPGYYWIWSPPRYGFHGSISSESHVRLWQLTDDREWLVFGDERSASDDDLMRWGNVILGRMTELWTGPLPPDHQCPDPPSPCPEYEPRETLEQVPALRKAQQSSLAVEAEEASREPKQEEA